MMTDFTDDPEFCRDLLHYCADVAMMYADAQIAYGADTIGMSDAAAGLLGPVLYKDFIVAEQMRVFKYIKEKHPAVMTRQHMCGRITKLAEDFATLPVDIYEIDFPSDLAKIKAVLGDRVISGNISTCVRGHGRAGLRSGGALPRHLRQVLYCELRMRGAPAEPG
jgi:uroporphyrinogen-III decarboxylase